MSRSPDRLTILLLAVLGSDALFFSPVAHRHPGDGSAVPGLGEPMSDRPLRAVVLEAPVPEAPRRWTVPILHTAGLFAGMQGSLWALWPDYFSPLRFQQMGEQFRASWTGPPDYRSDRRLLESDGDPWVLNVIGHGLSGSEVYLRFRQCGHRPLAAAASATIASTGWEYGIEAFHKRPSAIDLVWTPIVGSLLGEGRFQLYRLLRGQDPSGAGRGVLLFLVDPLSEVERALGTDC